MEDPSWADNGGNRKGKSAIMIQTTVFASWSSATNCYSCPKCSCGAVPDWKREAPLRCTGCKAPLASRAGLGS